MPRPQKFDIDPANIDANGVIESQTPNGEATMNGAQTILGDNAVVWKIGDSYPAGIAGARMAISVASDGITTTFTGLNQDGQSITEAVVGPAAAGLAETTQYFSEISSISTSGAQKAAYVVGAVDEVVTRSYPLNWRSREPAAYAIHNPVGTFVAVVEEYWDDPQNQLLATDGWKLVVTSSANTATGGELHGRAVRVKTTSYSAGAEFQFLIIQN